MLMKMCSVRVIAEVVRPPFSTTKVPISSIAYILGMLVTRCCYCGGTVCNKKLNQPNFLCPIVHECTHRLQLIFQHMRSPEHTRAHTHTHTDTQPSTNNNNIISLIRSICEHLLLTPRGIYPLENRNHRK